MTVVDRARACAALEQDRTRLLAAVGDPDQAPEIRYTTFWPEPLTPLDLVAHVTTWDEISLAVLTEARQGRAHWSVDGRWETPDAGRALNHAGVHLGRRLAPELVLHRFHATRDAFVAAIGMVPDDEWAAELPFRHSGDLPQTLGGLCHYVNTPEADPDKTRTYQHAAAHLGLDSV